MTIASGRRRLIYISNARLPSEKANSVQSMHQCEAFGRLADAEFWFPRRHNPLCSEPYAYYAVEPTFALRQLASWDPAGVKRIDERIGFLLQALSFQVACLVRLLRTRGPLLIYTRNSLDVFLAPLIRLFRPSAALIVEDHDGLLRRAPSLKRACLAVVDGIVVTTTHHQRELLSEGVPPERILVAPNGVDVKKFSGTARTVRPRRRIVYVGNLFEHKGVYTLAQALAHLPSAYTLEIVGGSPELQPRFATFLQERGLFSRVTCVGPIPHRAVVTHLQNADVAVVPNSARSDLSARLTSPLKLFEYMAAGVPVVASDVPALREVLTHDRNAWLVTPDDSVQLAVAIRTVCEDEALARRLVETAWSDVAGYTWEARAARVLRFAATRGGWIVPGDRAIEDVGTQRS
jgi:glycosyltransferase involved in cell wall biosynthesis